MSLTTEEQILIKSIAWDKGDGLVPAVIQDASTGDVLMLGYMNKESLAQTYTSKKVTFFSRSKQRLWVKGESSGNELSLVSIAIDCDQDTLLVKASPMGPVCHTGSETCFGQKDFSSITFLAELEKTIQSRKEQKVDYSYTSRLFNDGINKIAQKVGEEGVETVIAGLAEDDASLIGEASDLIYHLIVLLTERNLTLDDIVTELKKRSK